MFLYNPADLFLKKTLGAIFAIIFEKRHFEQCMYLFQKKTHSENTRFGISTFPQPSESTSNQTSFLTPNADAKPELYFVLKKRHVEHVCFCLFRKTYFPENRCPDSFLFSGWLRFIRHLALSIDPDLEVEVVSQFEAMVFNTPIPNRHWTDGGRCLLGNCENGHCGYASVLQLYVIEEGCPNRSDERMEILSLPS